MDKSLVSVIIPCYNTEKYIVECIESALVQTYENLEIIIVNDGSTDQSLQQIKSVIDKRCQIISVENGGVAKARNIGIAASKGAYIGFLDADDLYHKTNIEEKINFLEQNPSISLVHGFEEVFDSESKQIIEIAKGQDGEVLNSLLLFKEKVIHSPSSVVIRKELINKIGGFNEMLSTSADWEFWVRCAKEGSFGILSKALTKYRIHDAQMHMNVRKMEHDMLLSFKIHKGDGTFKDKRFYKNCLAKLELTLALSYIGDNKKYVKGLLFLFKSILHSPRPFIHRLFSYSQKNSR